MTSCLFYTAYFLNILSDHCTINFILENATDNIVINIDTNDENIENCNYIDSKYVWNNDLTESFLCALNSENIKTELNVLKSDIDDIECNNDIENTVQQLCNILDKIADSLFKKKATHRQNIYESDIKDCNPWFNEECADKRRCFNLNLNKYRDNKNDENRIELVKSR